MMQKDDFITEVVFRCDKKGEWKDVVYAMFPYNLYNNIYLNIVTGYTHIGQHSAYDYTWNISKSRPATESEYKALYKELEDIGYKLRIIKKRSYSKALNSLKQLNYEK